MSELKTFASQIARLKEAKQNFFKALNSISLFSSSITDSSRISEMALDLYPELDPESTATEIKAMLADRIGVSADKIQYSEDGSISILGVTGSDNNAVYNRLLEDIINFE